MIDLNGPDIRTVPINTLVKTRTGFIWKLLSRTLTNKETWLDQTSTLIWLPEEPKTYTYIKALKLETNEKRLPTMQEFKQAELHGIREILASMENKQFWFASIHSGNIDNVDSAWAFNGNNGNIGYDYPRSLSGSVRCVSY